MRRIALTALGFALWLSAVPLFSQTHATIEKTLESNEKSGWQGWKDHDAKQSIAWFTDDAISIADGGVFKGKEQLVKDCLQKCAVAFTGLFALDLEDAPCRPPDHGWINIAEFPFVGGKLAVGMLIPFAHDGIELAFGKMRIDQGEGNTLKGEVP